MIVYVDGHNALHALGVDAGGHEADRGTLVREVRERTRHGVVFFDGHPPPGEFAESQARGVRVVFSMSREADESIVDALRDEDQAGRVLVVTDDLGLARRVRQLGARTSRVGAFFAVDEKRETTAPEKPTDADGFTPADFGLPDVVDLNDQGLLNDESRSPGTRPSRRPRRPPRRR